MSVQGSQWTLDPVQQLYYFEADGGRYYRTHYGFLYRGAVDNDLWTMPRLRDLNISLFPAADVSIVQHRGWTYYPPASHINVAQQLHPAASPKAVKLKKGDQVYLRLYNGFNIPERYRRIDQVNPSSSQGPTVHLKIDQQRVGSSGVHYVYAGPFEVKKREDGDAYTLDFPPDWKIYPTISATYLIPYQADDPAEPCSGSSAPPDPSTTGYQHQYVVPSTIGDQHSFASPTGSYQYSSANPSTTGYQYPYHAEQTAANIQYESRIQNETSYSQHERNQRNRHERNHKRENDPAGPNTGQEEEDEHWNDDDHRRHERDRRNRGEHNHGQENQPRRGSDPNDEEEDREEEHNDGGIWWTAPNGRNVADAYANAMYSGHTPYGVASYSTYPYPQAST